MRKILYTEMAARKAGLIALFDVDGTLTTPRKSYYSGYAEVHAGTSKGTALIIVITPESNLVLLEGLTMLRYQSSLGTQSLRSYVGEEKEFINFMLHYIADLDIPIKRGTFIEFRNGMLNVSPIGRTEARKNGTSLKSMTSFDVFPQGWDKACCLRYVDDFHEIHFFGDRTSKGLDVPESGGNDHEIYESERTMGHTVASPEDTGKQCTALFLSKQVDVY
ncbi:unnamed protein product [Camellia sinensis]